MMKITKNIIIYCLLAGLYLIPFIVFLNISILFFPCITSKGFVFRILIEIIFAMYVCLAFIDNKYRPKMSWITKSILIFGGAILVSDLLGVSVYKSLWGNYERMEGFVLIVHLIMFYIVSSSFFCSHLKWSRFWNISIIASVIVSLYGVLQLVGYITIDPAPRVNATLGNATYLALYLVFHIFLCLYFLIDAVKPRWQKSLYILVIVFETIILYFTATRGATIGFIGGLILVALIVILKEKENFNLRKIFYWILGVVLIFIVIFINVKNTHFIKENPILARLSSFNVVDFHNDGRYFVWQIALKGVIERPIFGWGQENFNYVFYKYYDPRMYNHDEWFDRAHDIVLDWLIAGGIVGFLAYVGIYMALLYYLWRKKSYFNLAEKSIFTGLIAAYVFNNIFSFDNIISYILFFSMLAYVHSMSVIKEENANKFYTKKFGDAAVNYIVLPVATVLAISCVYYVNVPAIKANFALLQALSPQDAGIEKNISLFKQVYSYNSLGSLSGEATENLLRLAIEINNFSVPGEIKQEFFSLAKEKVDIQLIKTPTATRLLVLAGTLMNCFLKYDDAIIYLNRAVATSPRMQKIYNELSVSYLNKREYVKTLDILKKAYELEPDYPESKILYALSGIYVGNKDVLKKMLAVIPDNTVISDNRFLNAYAVMGDYNSVIRILNARLAKDPENVQLQLSLDSVYAIIDKKNEA